MAELGKLQYPRASGPLFSRARGRAPAARALEGGRENPGDPVKDQNSGQSRSAGARQSPHRRAPHRQSESEYPVRLTKLPSDLEPETAEPSRELRHLPWTILLKGRDPRAAPFVTLRCSKRPCLRCASAVPVPLPVLLPVGHKKADWSLNGAPSERRERHVHRLDVSRRRAVCCLPVE